jgi:hypothetical protein
LVECWLVVGAGGGLGLAGAGILLDRLGASLGDLERALLIM